MYYNELYQRHSMHLENSYIQYYHYLYNGQLLPYK